MVRITFIQRIISFVLIAVVGVGLLSVTRAQDIPTAITVTGTVEAINGTTIIVSGANVDVTNAVSMIPSLQVGVVVQITGSFSNGVLIATTIIIINPTITPTPEATAILTPEATETLTPESTAVVTPSPIATGDDTIIIIEGPVQAININIITIFNINIQVDGNDPFLTQVQIGDNVRVEGHAVPQGNTIIIIAVNVTIVNETIVNPPQGGSPGLPPGCKITPKGHIKCTKKNK